MRKIFNYKWQISFTIVLFSLGIFLSLQFKTQQNILNRLETQNESDLLTMWKSLDDKRNDLAKEISTLQEKYDTLQQQSTLGDSNLNNIVQNTDELEIINGTKEITGKGLIIHFKYTVPLISYDYIDIINELLNAGAEAISINEHRITNFTSIEQIEKEYTYYTEINGQRLTFPITIKAIGNPNTLEKGLTFTGGIIDGLNEMQISPTMTKMDNITLPASINALNFNYLKNITE